MCTTLGHLPTDPNQLDEQQLCEQFAGYLPESARESALEPGLLGGDWDSAAYMLAGDLAALKIRVPADVLAAARAMWGDDPLLTDFSERLNAIPVAVTSSVA